MIDVEVHSLASMPWLTVQLMCPAQQMPLHKALLQNFGHLVTFALFFNCLRYMRLYNST